ncbi:MAG TPA: excinuclease ABC subunit UvrC [Clostridia bacterium]|nr:excinuclease ABC subunit UvrC [Clostridia bacterium]
MFDIQEELKKLPDKPGVYLMKDENGTIIYVGKAVVLKNRVRQYFQSSAAHTPKVTAMVAKIAEFEYIVTDTELEALILECNLIKDLKPKFNILLKDDKTYPYIKITMNEDYPRVIMTRRVEKDGARYFGPYSSVFSVRETIRLIKRIFPLKSCKKVLPRDIGKGRPCLNYHIKQCLGPCSGNVDKEEYRSVMRDICTFLDGRQDAIIGKLEKQMEEAADKLDFEKAASLRDKLSSLKHIAQEQKVLSLAGTDQDIIGFAASKTDTCVQIFFIRGGKLLGRQHFIMEGTGEGELRELASSFIKQFYGDAAVIPPEIISATEFDDIDVIEEWLGSKRGGRVRVKVPQRGEKLHMVEMVTQNARIELEHFNERLAGGSQVQEGLQEMAGLLGLEKPPLRLEAYDISNTGSSEIVASMVVFENGQPAKKEYRRFKIRSTEIQNDYASMQEVIYRRFKHAEAERSAGEGPDNAEEPDSTQEPDSAEGLESTRVSDSTQRLDITQEPDSAEDQNGAQTLKAGSDRNNAGRKFSKLPDLLMLDGGLGHVHAIGEVLDELGVTIPVCGMVKDDKHRTRGLVLAEREIDLTRNLTVLRFVTSVQDEAHRFALEYNKTLRTKRYSKSILDEIEGIGPKRKKALLKHFGSLARLKQAGVDDLQAVEGISRTQAEKLYEFFRS